MRTGVQLRKLVADDDAAQDYLGISLDIDDGKAIVGAYGDDDNGAISGSGYIFDVTTGTQLQKIVPDDGVSNKDFASKSVDMEGDIVIATAHLDDEAVNNGGAAYVFNATTGDQIRKITAGDAASGDRFGESVFMGDEVMFVGALSTDGSVANSGSVYKYTCP